jgi:hypothetical protein
MLTHGHAQSTLDTLYHPQTLYHLCPKLLRSAKAAPPLALDSVRWHCPRHCRPTARPARYRVFNREHGWTNRVAAIRSTDAARAPSALETRMRGIARVNGMLGSRWVLCGGRSCTNRPAIAPGRFTVLDVGVDPRERYTTCTCVCD